MQNRIIDCERDFWKFELWTAVTPWARDTSWWFLARARQSLSNVDPRQGIYQELENNQLIQRRVYFKKYHLVKLYGHHLFA